MVEHVSLYILIANPSLVATKPINFNRKAVWTRCKLSNHESHILVDHRMITKIGDHIGSKFEEMGVLNFENLPTDGDTAWSELVKPLEVTEAA